MKATVPGESGSGLLEGAEVLPFKQDCRTTAIVEAKFRDLNQDYSPHLQMVKPTRKGTA